MSYARYIELLSAAPGIDARDMHAFLLSGQMARDPFAAVVDYLREKWTTTH